jgi:hypothetical protein
MSPEGRRGRLSSVLSPLNSPFSSPHRPAEQGRFNFCR